MYEEPIIIASYDAADILGDAYGNPVGNGSVTARLTPHKTL